ncbi:MAG: alpha/beta hydrolase [Magnetococcales bacterium]|nr:alpha/beta hydrolase [Magnetococcales bacterium]
MLIVSCRRDFTDSDNLSVKGLQYADIDLNMPQAPNRVANNFNGAIKPESKVLVLVHGYNNDYYHVLSAYTLIDKEFQQECQNRYDHIIGFIWPGGDHGVEYFSARNRCPESSVHFQTLIQQLQANGCSVAISAHSMGCRVVMKALDQFIVKGGTLPKDMEIFLSAAAVDNEVLEPGEDYYKVTCVDKPIYVFHSKHDDTLKLAYAAAELDLALGLTGPENPEKVNETTCVVNCKNIVHEHTEYKRRKKWYQFINAQLAWALPTNKFCTIP